MAFQTEFSHIELEVHAQCSRAFAGIRRESVLSPRRDIRDLNAAFIQLVIVILLLILLLPINVQSRGRFGRSGLLGKEQQPRVHKILVIDGVLQSAEHRFTLSAPLEALISRQRQHLELRRKLCWHV